MHPRYYLRLAAAAMVASGCSQVNVSTYSGVIQRVETGEFLGYTVSPIANSASPLVHPVHVYVSLGDTTPSRPRVVRIDFLDIADARSVGTAGDRVNFAWRGELPVDGRIAAEALAGYRVGNTAAKR